MTAGYALGVIEMAVSLMREFEKIRENPYTG
jgi:hypothetical protein